MRFHNHRWTGIPGSRKEQSWHRLHTSRCILELNVYNDNKKTGKMSTFLGKVKVVGSTFLRCGSEALVYYPLEKRSVFLQIKGEIGIKICYEDEEPSPAPVAEEQEIGAAETPSVATDGKSSEDKKAEEETEGEGLINKWKRSHHRRQITLGINKHVEPKSRC
ncbi:hypothetical protein L6452_37636 [Arctium lappa]|uniref:Uncharacterized protein n=1 Tax=Arctium lappa TaxID=4217 RepID=A0ACB8Y2R7_ARCLA|nr:hypothetical protein L6452_37636 [Arctium lappa]